MTLDEAIAYLEEVSAAARSMYGDPPTKGEVATQTLIDEIRRLNACLLQPDAASHTALLEGYNRTLADNERLRAENESQIYALSRITTLLNAWANGEASKSEVLRDIGAALGKPF